jgi:acyl carrier protein
VFTPFVLHLFHFQTFYAGTAYNQDGRSSGLTAPNGPAQTSLVRTALATAHSHPDVVQLMSMHGTGTPLGDPIEVNALGHAMETSSKSSSRNHHLVTLASAKACFGHTEGAAGIHGALAAILGLQRQTAPPVMHARTLNPYVSSALVEWQEKHLVNPNIPREERSWSRSVSTLAGCSSFGMSGTNAHGLFSVTDSFIHRNNQSTTTSTAIKVENSNSDSSLLWHHSRYWPLALANHMLASNFFDRSSGMCKFLVSLASPQLAFLIDHIIQNTPIIPGAGMLETAAAACSSLRDVDVSSGRLLCLTGASIPAPVVLSASTASAATLECQVVGATGEVQLRSARGSAFQLHFKASAGRILSTSTNNDENENQENISSNTIRDVLFTQQKKRKYSIQCTAMVMQPISTSCSTSGFLSHPAIVDNALQLGPATGDVGKEDDAEVTRVVAGISAFVVGKSQNNKAKDGFVATPTATERKPMAADGTIITNHWLLSDDKASSVFVMNLQAKVINLEARGSSASAAAAEDRSRLMYAVEWQASTSDPLVVGEEEPQQLSSNGPTYVLTHSDAAAPTCFNFFSTASSDPAQATAETCSTHVALVQNVMQLPGSAPRGQMQLHSHGAHPATRAPTGADTELRSSAAALSMQSFMRVASAEYPATIWNSVDLQREKKSSLSLQKQKQLVDTVAGGTDMYCRISGAGIWTAPRLLVRTPPPSRANDLEIMSGMAEHLAGSVVITGGMGALGTLMATWLCNLGGTPTLWLLGRSGRISGDSLPPQLYKTLGQIVCARGDVSSSEEAADIVFRSSASAAEPLRSVMHAGAVLDSKVISNVTAHSIRTEYSGKVFGAQQLVTRCSNAALASFQLFSSLASFSGAAGQATYAAANGVLDAWAHATQGSGVPAVAVQWGNWGGGGMAVRNKGFIERMEKMGLGIIDPDRGLSIMARMLYETAIPSHTILSTKSWNGAVSVGNLFLWDNIIKVLPAVPAFLEEFARPEVLEAKKKALVARTADASKLPIRSTDLTNSPAGKKRGRGRGRRGGRRQAAASASGGAAQQQQAATGAAVLSVILGIMENLGGAASPEQPFMDSGIDSLGAVQLRNEIATAFGVELQPTVTFDHPTPAALAKHVALQVSGDEIIAVPDGPAVEQPVKQQQENTDPVPAAASTSSALATADVLHDVMSVVENVLGTAVDAEDPLMASGLDSLGAVQLRNAISERFGVELPATAALDYPTGSAIATHIAKNTGVAIPGQSSAVVSVGRNELFYYSDSESGLDGMTEIVGVSCIYPGQASEAGAAGFWKTAINSEDLPCVIPPGRWDIEKYYAPDVTGTFPQKFLSLLWY